MADKLHIAEVLEHMRQIRGLSQSQLAAKCGLQPSAISHYETGRREPSLRNTRRLSTALGVTSDQLLCSAAPPAGDKYTALYNQLTERDRQTVISLMESMLTPKGSR